MNYIILIIVGIAGIIMGSYFGRRRRAEKSFDEAQDKPLDNTRDKQGEEKEDVKKKRDLSAKSAKPENTFITKKPNGSPYSIG
ncbi:MAG: hypothetical protein V1877_00655 [Candidatus Tagabacteria bacterium]